MNPTPGEQDHEVLRMRLGALVLGGLEAGERAEVEAHLTGCAACRAEIDELAPLAAGLAVADPDAVGPRDDDDRRGEPTPAGFAAILDRIGAEGSVEADVVPLAPRVRPARTRLLVAAAGVLIARAGLGAGIGVGVGLGEPAPESVAVQALTPGVEASAGTIDHTWGVEVVLTASGFAPGQAYEVAVLDRDGRAVEAGAFVGTGGTEMVCRLNSALLREDATGFVVTDAAGGEVLRSRFA